MRSSISESSELIPSINELADRFVRAFPPLDADDQELALKLLALLSSGKPVPQDQLAETLNRDSADVRRKLRQWSGVFYDDAHNVVAFFGVSVRETHHRLLVNGNTSFAWCAWDTLFIPTLLNTTVDVSSTCAQSGAAINLIVSPAGIDSVQPSDTVLSFLTPDESELRNDITTSFCHFIHFFRTREDGEIWASNHAGTFLLSLDDAFLLGEKMNAARYHGRVNRNFT